MKKKFSLSPEELEAFRKNGVAGPFDLYEADEIIEKYKRIRAELFDRTYASYGLDVKSVIAGYDRHLDVNDLSDHIMRREIVDRVESILGPDVCCWRSELFPKYPGDEGTDWHQADTYAHASGKPQVKWPMGSEFGGAITVWCALTDVTEENGCMRFIPGTHEEMIYDESKEMTFNPENVNNVERNGMKRGFFGYDYKNLQKDPDYVPDESAAISMEMKAGQFVIFWSTLMHSSFPNSTKDKTRLAYAARYVPSCVEIYPDTDVVEEYGSVVSLDKYGVVVVAGKDDYKHNRVVTENNRGYKFSY
ncbi:chlorinating enzyme [Aliikangiella sp. IMCC44359]|uniref:chlorinating enzyme n=1 Tax=Aliikangiella sp. IMCC44359 TaxID=3459125 RepID=UPI00403B28BD